jgi:hypothetical protein
VEKVDTLIVTSSTGSNEAISPRAKSNCFDSGSVDPAMLLSAFFDLLDPAATYNCVNTAYAISLNQHFFCSLSLFSGAAEDAVSMEQTTEIVIATSCKHRAVVGKREAANLLLMNHNSSEESH